MRWLTAYKVSGVVWRCGGGGGVGNVVVYHYRCELPLYRPATGHRDTAPPPPHSPRCVSLHPATRSAGHLTATSATLHNTRYVTTSSLMQFLPFCCVPPWNWIVLIEFLVELFPEIDSDI